MKINLNISDLEKQVEWIRSQFPALHQRYNNNEYYTFLDGPGGTQVTNSVIDAVSNYYKTINSNTHGVYPTSMATDSMIYKARCKAGYFLNCNYDEVVFGQNMTSLTFSLSRSLGSIINKGDEVLLTRLEHDANFTPWKLIAEEKGANIKVVDINNKDCTLNMEDLQDKIGKKTKVVAVGLASNFSGTINDVEKIIKIAHSYNALVYIDAVHYAPHGLIDVKHLNCDFLVCSAYKFFGPHIGILYIKKRLQNELKCYKVRPSPENFGEKWEQGTLNHEGLAGFISTVEYIESLGNFVSPITLKNRDAIVNAMNWVKNYEILISQYLIINLLKIPEITIYGITELGNLEWRVPTFSFRVNGFSPLKVCSELAKFGICAWNGNFYAINTTESLKIENSGGAIRVGFLQYNTIGEVNKLIDSLNSIISEN